MCARFWLFWKFMFIFHVGIISSWGRGGEMDLFDGQNQPKFYRFWSVLIWKTFRFKKSLFSWLTYTVCHNDAQKVLFPSLKPRESGRILYFRSKSPFFEPKTQTALSQPYFWSQSQTLYGIMYPMIGSIDFATKLKITPKILFHYSDDFNEQHS